MEQNAKCSATTRRRHLPEFKARVVKECAQVGASVAAVALRHGLNANLVHRWRRQARQADFCAAATAPAAAQQLMPPSGGAPVAPSTVTAMTRPEPSTGIDANPGGKGGPTGTFIALVPPTVATLDERTAPTSVDQADSIHVDIQRNLTHVRIRWPTSAASDCALLLGDLWMELLQETRQAPQQGRRRDLPRRGAPR